MNEHEWHEATDPHYMLKFLELKFLEGKTIDRKLSLFALSCCGRILHLITDAGSRSAVEMFSRWLEGQTNDQEMRQMSSEAYQAAENAEVEVAVRTIGLDDYHRAMKTMGQFNSLGWETAQAVKNAMGADSRLNALRAASEVTRRVYATPPSDYGPMASCASLVSRFAARAVARPDEELNAWDQERTAQQDLLRDILGNPFRPIEADPAWLTPTVVQLAQGIYQERAFDRMSILADALQDAGCDNEDVLNHCRSDRPHVRGCWVVDLLLCKE